tara:strand:+ start:256 stop:939 length:684 start_codon:yes stop_codon:yes gene_type:complete
VRFRFTSNADEFKRAVKKAGDKLPKAAKKGLQEMKEDWVKRMKEQHFTGYYEGLTRGSKLRSRSGALKSSVGGRVLGSTLPSLRALLRVGGGRVQTRGGYAPLQEYGSDEYIKPKPPKRFLTVPLESAMTGRGVLKAAAKIRKYSVKGRRGYYTDMGRIFFVPSKKSSPLLAVEKGTKGDVTALYILRKKVKVPGRLDAQAEVEIITKQHGPKIARRLLRVLVEAKG